MSDPVPSQRWQAPHGSWTELTEHLMDHFPQIQAEEVVEIVTRSRRAAQTFGLPEDEHLETVELAARYQLLQLTGQVNGTARLKPESRHQRDRNHDLAED